MYAQKIPDNGPIPTTISFEAVGKDVELIGETTEGEGHEAFDEVFEMDIKYFEGEAVFVQKVRLLNKETSSINGSVEFMVCNDKNCLPPTSEDIIFNLNAESQISTFTTSENSNVISGVTKSEPDEKFEFLYVHKSFLIISA